MTILNINNRENLRAILNNLSSETPALFGLMTAQHMIEHLILVTGFSNGKLHVTPQYPEEKIEKMKTIIIQSPREISKGFKSPLLPEDSLLNLEYIDLNTAIDELFTALDQFDTHLKNNETLKPVHPTFGALNYDEWVIFHNKHFTHHFKQFGLIESI